jgi:hypothetical protein
MSPGGLIRRCLPSQIRKPAKNRFQMISYRKVGSKGEYFQYLEDSSATRWA